MVYVDAENIHMHKSNKNFCKVDMAQILTKNTD